MHIKCIKIEILVGALPHTSTQMVLQNGLFIRYLLNAVQLNLCYKISIIVEDDILDINLTIS